MGIGGANEKFLLKGLGDCQHRLEQFALEVDLRVAGVRREWLNVASTLEVRPMRKALQVMGLTAEATLEDVKAKYKALVKQHHPDANGGDRSTEDRLIEIIKAYNYLKTVVRGA